MAAADPVEPNPPDPQGTGEGLRVDCLRFRDVLRAGEVRLSPVVLYAVCAALAWTLAYRDVRLSTVAMLLLEFLSIFVIAALAAVILMRSERPVDLSLLSLKGVSPRGVGLGLVFAVFSFVGFESATSLGHEARQPLRTIPRAVLSSTLVAGCFFIFMGYVEVLGFRDSPTPLHQIDAPLAYLARQTGVPAYGVLISLGAVISFFACALPSITAGARVTFALAHPGVLHPLLGHAHPRNQTPDVAVTMTALCAFAGAAALSLLGVRVLDVYNYTGTLATYGFLLIYLLVSVAAPVFLHRERALRRGDVVLSVVSALFVLAVAAGAVYPPPAAPFDALPWVFVGVLAVGAVWFRMLQLHGKGSA